MTSWKTTTLGIITILIAVCTAVAEFIKTGQIPNITVLISQITAGIGLLTAKDHNVSNAAMPVSASLVKSLLIFAMIGAVAVGCATNTGDPVKDRRGRVTNATLEILGKFVLNTATNYLGAQVQSHFSDEPLDMTHAAADAVWKATGSIDAASDYKKIIDAYSGGELKPIAGPIAAKVTELGLPANDPRVTNAVARNLSNATNTFYP